MAEKKKRKSIYDKPLKDINKDGKVNFGDTWLGDALGFDGKMGIQKGRPGLRESLKGARRGKAESKEDTPKRPRSRPSKSEETTTLQRGPSTRSRVGSRDSESLQRGPSTRARRSPAKTEVKPAPVSIPKAPPKTEGGGIEGAINRANERQSDARAKAIETARTERANKPTEAQIQAWIKKQPATWHRANKTTEDKRAAAMKALSGKSGMAMGGMAMKKEGRYQQNGGRDMKKTGMFYKSSSPRGYK